MIRDTQPYLSEAVASNKPYLSEAVASDKPYLSEAVASDKPYLGEAVASDERVIGWAGKAEAPGKGGGRTPTMMMTATNTVQTAQRQLRPAHMYLG